MRKRSEAPQQPAVVSPTNPATAKTEAWEPPDNVFVKDGILFFLCKCGMKISVHSATQVHDDPTCISCGAELDPKHTLTKERMEMLVRSNFRSKTPEPLAKETLQSAAAAVNKKVCEKCGSALTEVPGMGPFYSCGHDPTKIQSIASSSPRPAAGSSDIHIHNGKGQSGQKFSVTFGEMVFSPVQYSSFRVGPFLVEDSVRDGETLVAAMTRAHAFLVSFAEIEFERKTKQYLESLGRLSKRS